jgi:hypothetical protein
MCWKVFEAAETIFGGLALRIPATWDFHGWPERHGKGILKPHDTRTN